MILFGVGETICRKSAQAQLQSAAARIDLMTFSMMQAKAIRKSRNTKMRLTNLLVIALSLLIFLLILTHDMNSDIQNEMDR
jgi:hypothetical protein